MKNSFFKTMFFVFVLCSLQISAQENQKQTTTCNPLNLSYRFQLDQPSRREAADPTMISFKGKYFLFASKSGGYWTSDNLLSWTFITTTDLPLEDYAPAAVVMNDAIYFMGQDKQIYKSADPLSGKWVVVKVKFPFSTVDPCLFLDDDSRLYLYYGCSNFTPIYGIELDINTFDPIGTRLELISKDVEHFGWERTGDYNENIVFKGKTKPWLEGPWMTKYKGKYYLQYATPGTEFKSYADGLYIGNSPLGTFKVAENNPCSYKPEGFIAGAGHSSTFQDKWGNYWHIVSMTISVKHQFERRLGLFPAFFDKDGTFYTYTGFGDFPHVVPQKRMRGPEDYQPSGMLLSYKKPVEVSSTLDGHPKENATNEEIRKYWSAETGNKGEWIMVDLQNSCKVNAVQLNFAEEATTILGRTGSIYYQYLLEYSNDKKSWKTLRDNTTSKIDAPHDYVELKAPVSARYIRLTNYHVPDGKFAISGLRVFGKGNGKVARPVSSFTAVRDTTDARNVTLTWQKSANVTGYNIRYGTAPDKLYLNYQVLDTNSLTIHSLNALQSYYFTIDTFNENGITKGNLIIESKQFAK
jgi:xylan 1,4-beta-xylosidase